MRPTWLTGCGYSNMLTGRTWRENGTLPRFCVTYDGVEVQHEWRYDPYRLNPAVAEGDMGVPYGFVTGAVPNLRALAEGHS
jgi:hypothetical protein